MLEEGNVDHKSLPGYALSLFDDFAGNLSSGLYDRGIATVYTSADATRDGELFDRDMGIPTSFVNSNVGEDLEPERLIVGGKAKRETIDELHAWLKSHCTWEWFMPSGENTVDCLLSEAEDALDAKAAEPDENGISRGARSRHLYFDEAFFIDAPKSE